MKENKNPFEAFDKKDEMSALEINKAAIYAAMRQNVAEGSLFIEKTGKEIKDQITNAILPIYRGMYDKITSKLNALLETTGLPPTQDIINYNNIALELPYKEYTWKETCAPKSCEDKNNLVAECCGDECCCCEENTIFSNFGEVDIVEENKEVVKDNLALNKEQADARQKYNDTLYLLKDVSLDIKTLGVLMQFDDNKKYKLNTEQAIALKF